ncbi:hypothetical protein MBLNU457_g0391t1 [Dothideomycetes sp. NU457]
MEDSEAGATEKAQLLIRIFGAKFRRMAFTLHPKDLAGEARGKSSNQSWAANEAIKYYRNNKTPCPEVLVTTMDADTHLMPSYFELISNMHEADPINAPTTMYVPPIAFDRNIHKIPALVRLADVLWCCAGLSGDHSKGSVRIPTSVYTLPMTLIENVEGWDTGPDSIGEDIHMYLKCSLALRGNLNTRVVYSPASQCDVDSGESGFMGYLAALVSRFNQALRHSWGALDFGFTVRGLVEPNPLHEKQYGRFPLKGTNSQWTAFSSISSLQNTATRTPPAPIIPPSTNYSNMITIFQRLTEAHILLAHFLTCLASSALYSLLVPRGLIPAALRDALGLCDYIRLVSYVIMLVAFSLFQRYHTVCVEIRKDFLRRVGLLEDFRAKDFISDKCFSTYGFIEVMIFPIAGIAFGSAPNLVAIFCHLWTDKLVYSVSLKPRAVVVDVEDGLELES